MKNSKKPSFMTVVIVLFLLMVLAVPVVMLVVGLRSAEEYRRVADRLVTVDAVITSHSVSEDSDGDETYHSHATYTVGGVTYRGVQVQSTSSESELHPVGKALKLRVNPDDPETTEGDMRFKTFLALLPLSLVVICVSFWIRHILERGVSKECRAPSEQMLLQRDLTLKVAAAVGRKIFLLGALMLFAWAYRYPMLGGDVMLLLGCTLAFFWFVGACKALRSVRQIRNGDYEIQWETLEDKKFVDGGEDADKYYLYFRNQTGLRKKSVSSATYQRAQIGAKLQTVYLSGRKTPIMEYDTCL